MSTAHVLLGLLSGGPQHGYDLKRNYDERLPLARPIAFGQVYATLDRLERDGLVTRDAEVRAGGPDRTPFQLTPDGEKALGVPHRTFPTVAVLVVIGLGLLTLRASTTVEELRTS